jgi:hypothetical protein
VTRYARLAFAGLAWLFVAMIVIQVFLIGLGLFGDASYRAMHIEFGYTWVGLAALALLVSGLLARPGRRTVGLVVAVFVLYIVQIFLPSARQSYPAIAALHPVNALLLFGLALYLARSAMALARVSDASQGPVAATATPPDATS